MRLAEIWRWGMYAILTKLGFQFYELGSPPIEAVVRQNQRIVRFAFGGCVICVILGLVAAMGFLGLADQQLTVGVLYLAMSALFTLMALSLEGVDQLASRRIILDMYCPTLKEWVDTYSEVKLHVAAINDQNRPILMGDLHFLEAWVAGRESEERAARRHAACQALHGVSAE